MARRRRKPHGVFCLEGEWWGNMKKPASVKPLLELLRCSPYDVPFIHRSVDTRASLEHYLGKWTQARHADYPILYLAFHGEEGRILIGDLRRRESEVTLDLLAALLEGKCRKRIVYFTSCSTMRLHGHRLNRFLGRTKALAVCGYEGEVGWLESAAFELLVFAAMQDNALTLAGARAMRRRISAQAPQLERKLGFRMKVRPGRKAPKRPDQGSRG